MNRPESYKDYIRPPKPLGSRQTKPASLWSDLTKDYKTGHYVYKDLAKVLSFVVGVSIVVFSAYADYQNKRPVSEWGAGMLLGYALGTALLKVAELQQNRKTTDDNGNPLAQPGTAEAPGEPKPMLPDEKA